MRRAIGILFVAFSQGAFAWVHPTYECKAGQYDLSAEGAGGGRLMDFVSNQDLDFDFSGARFQVITEGPANPLSPATGYILVISHSGVTASTRAPATEEKMFVTLNMGNVSYVGECHRK